MLQFPPWKVFLIVGTILIGAMLALPNMLSEKQRSSLPGFMPRDPVNLGLDLQGGVYLLLEVDHERAVLKQLDDLRREARDLMNSRTGADQIAFDYLTVNPAAVQVQLSNADQMEAAMAALSPLTTADDGSPTGILVQAKGSDIVRVSFGSLKMDAIKQNPKMSFSGEFNRIEADVKRRLRPAEASGDVQVREITTTRPRITLKPRNPAKIDDVRNALKQLNKSVNGPLASNDLNIARNDFGEVTIAFTSAKEEEIKRSSVRQTVAKLGPRLDPNGLGELTIQPQGESRIIVEAPGEKDPVRLKNLIQQPGELTLNLVDDNQTRIQQAIQNRRAPDGFMLVPSSVEGGMELLVEDTPIVTGDMIEKATPTLDPELGSYVVNFELNIQGAKKFGRASGLNVNRQFAIILDGKWQSAPSINEPILGGAARITGNFTQDSSNVLATVIQAGALPADVLIEEERQVGASLGEDSIRAGATASIIGLILVAIFMIIAYGLFGVYAVGSLVVNIILILGALSLFGATLTLPGIAGIILTIGMAVDANVLVFERIREEARNGRRPMTAIDTGYQQALSTILDANITTLLAAAVLYTLGSGPVKGFAVTLAIGIFTSVFTAFVVTRWFTVTWLKVTKPKKLPV